MASGYYDSSGTDLDNRFDVVNDNAGTLGFQLSNGQDLGNRYPYGSIGTSVGYHSDSGTDIGYLRTKKAAPVMTGYSASVQKYSSGTNTISAVRNFVQPGCSTAIAPRCCVSHSTLARGGQFGSGIITVRGICDRFNYGDVGWRIHIKASGPLAVTLAYGTSVPSLGTVTRGDLFGTVWSNTQDADKQPNYRTIDYTFPDMWSSARDRTFQFSYGGYRSGGYYYNMYCQNTRENITDICRDCTIVPYGAVNLTISQIFFNSVGDTGWYSNTVNLM
jgi:hypothetical protein